ncbi:hypothetical protein C7379_101113 [Hallella colorans]|uniref:Uncharacterized protein n=1 Tax=Hallella colorans TaxID=1703337 RepID=A0A2U0UNY3_9BACT|nr:hypothetical protein C7379_101113 [Hallella colorans]
MIILYKVNNSHVYFANIVIFRQKSKFFTKKKTYLLVLFEGFFYFVKSMIIAEKPLLKYIYSTKSMGT